MDGNHHLHKPVMIGEVRADGQFNVVWRTKTAIRAQPWSPFIAGNAGQAGCGQFDSRVPAAFARCLISDGSRAYGPLASCAG